MNSLKLVTANSNDVMVSDNKFIARINAAKTALAEAHTIQQIKTVLDAVIAAKVFAKRQKLTEETRDEVERLVRLAKLQLAEQLEGQVLAPHRPQKLSGGLTVKSTLDELDISRNLSSECGKIRGLPEPELEAWLNGAITLKEAMHEQSRRSQRDRARKTAHLTEHLHSGVRKGDFRTVLSDIPDASIALILTDPPYPREFLPLWSDLAKFAASKLAPGGILASYSGQMFLPEVIARLGEHLDYWWCGAVVHAGNGNLANLGSPVRKVINRWKPILLFVRKGDGYASVFRDLVPGSGPEKDAHNWAQPIAEAEWLIEMLSDENDLVVDPFAGSGTVGIACDTGKRRFIGAEIL